MLDSRDERETRVKKHAVVMGYDLRRSTLEHVAYTSFPADDETPETILLRRRLTTDMGEPLHITVTVEPGDRLEL